MVKISINPSKIGSVIGPGGKTIRSIVEQTKATIDIEDDGRVAIFAENGEILEKTIKLVENFVKDVKVGEVYTGRVVKIAKFGAFMEILPGKEGLLHVSEIAKERIAKVEDVLKVGDEFEVKVIGVENGKINLSKKALLQ
jgi:polyribonucleotide nucleotidyltransferase